MPFAIFYVTGRFLNLKSKVVGNLECFYRFRFYYKNSSFFLVYENLEHEGQIVVRLPSAKVDAAKVGRVGDGVRDESDPFQVSLGHVSTALVLYRPNAVWNVLFNSVHEI